MNPELAAFLETLYHQGREHDAPLADRLLRLRNMTPDAAGLIATLIRANGGGRVLEIGTSNGYSAIWFADAARDLRGRVTTVEIEADRAARARQNLAEAGVAEWAEVVHADAAEILAAAAPASADVIVLDAERPAYPDYLPHLARALAPHGVVAVDNSVSHAAQVAPFRALVEADPRFSVHLHELGDGVLTAVRIA
ncbi:MAG TPA: class I SAM-dependent methyltransferase [Streptosporangiaceae bacterium]|jgi:predicted O-methyltransferase YrrM